MTGMTAEDILERIDVEHITKMAWLAGRRLIDYEVARVELTPNDGTRYEIIVTDARMHRGEDVVHYGADYVVTLVNCEGRSYYWNGGHLDVGYVQDKWVDRLWSAVVLTAFLNALAEPEVNTSGEEA